MIFTFMVYLLNVVCFILLFLRDIYTHNICITANYKKREYICIHDNVFLLISKCLVMDFLMN